MNLELLDRPLALPPVLVVDHALLDAVVVIQAARALQHPVHVIEVVVILFVGARAGAVVGVGAHDIGGEQLCICLRDVFRARRMRREGNPHSTYFSPESDCRFLF